MLNSFKSLFSDNHKNNRRNAPKTRVCQTEFLEDRTLLTVAPTGDNSLDLVPALVSGIQTPDTLLVDVNDIQTPQALQASDGGNSSVDGIDTYKFYSPDRGTKRHGRGDPITLEFIIDKEFDKSKNATLILRVLDVDYENGQYGKEWDTVEINNQITLDKPLTGAHEQWSEPSFTFSAQYLHVGINTITIHPDVRHVSMNWVVACEYGILKVSHNSSLSIVKDSITIEDQSGLGKQYKDLGETNVEDAFIQSKASLKTTLQLPDSCNSKADAINAVSSISWKILKKSDGDENPRNVGFINLEQNELDQYSSYNSSTHQLTIDKNDWFPDETAFGLVQVECSVTTTMANEMTLMEVKDNLRIGVTEYDISFGRAIVDNNTGGVKTIDGKSIENSFDRSVSSIDFTRYTISRVDYDKKFLNKSKKEQWKSLVSVLVDNNAVSFKEYNAAKNAIAAASDASQKKMIGSLLNLFDDYHFYVLFGKETNNTYESVNGKIKNPESDIMHTIYVPSLADSESYSADDGKVEILARLIAYEDWKPGSLIIYTKWDKISGEIAGGGEIVLTPYVVALKLDKWNGFQGFGLMNASVSAQSCKDNYFISRGTEVYKLNDIITDLNEDGVGYSQFIKVKDNVLNWISKLQTRSVTLTGHSLGGALSQWFACDCANKNILGKVKKITTFNSAGLTFYENSESWKTAFNKFNNNSSGIDIDHYISNGDIISFAGEKFIGKGQIVHLITYSAKNGKENKHSLWLANDEWRNSFNNTFHLDSKKDISVNVYNNYWFHWTQDRYLSTSKKDYDNAFLHGTTEQKRQNAFPRTFYPGFDDNRNYAYDCNEWWLSGINSDFYDQTKYLVNQIESKIDVNKYKGLTISSGITYGSATLSTLSGMDLPVVLAYKYPARKAPSNDSQCLLNGIYVKKAERKTKFGEFFTLAEDADFTFTSNTGYAYMTSDSVELKADVLKLKWREGLTIVGSNYSEKMSGSSMNLTSMSFNTGGEVASITANASGKKMTFNFSGSYFKAYAYADLNIVLSSQDVLKLTDAYLCFSGSQIEVCINSGTFNNKPVNDGLLIFDGTSWRVSRIALTNGTTYEAPDPNQIKNVSIYYSFEHNYSFVMTPSDNTKTQTLAFNWSNSVDNPHLIFKVNNVVYAESEMIDNGYLLLYTESDTSRSYIVKNSSANNKSWSFDSAENLENVQVLLQTYDGDITPAQVTSVNTAITNNSKATVTFGVKNMSSDSLIQIAVRQTGQTEDVLNFNVPVSKMTQVSGGYRYVFDLADYDLTTGDYQIYAWSDESLVENAAVSGSFRVTMQSNLVLSQTSLRFSNTNAKQESAVKNLTISNTGNAKALFTLSLADSEEITEADFSISGVYSNGNDVYFDCIELDAGKSVTLNVQFTPQSAGRKSWKVELLDFESSEKRGEFTLSGTGLAMLSTDVAITADNSSLSETSITAGDPLSVSGTLRNTGANVSDSITVSLYASQNSNDLRSGILLDSYEGIILEGGAEEAIPFYVDSTIDLSAGNWYLGFVIDCDNDSSTSNNVSVFSSRLSVAPSSYDSVMQNVSATPVDLNSNGFYDALKVSGTLNVETAGTYTVVWTLWDGETNKITQVSQDYSLRSGSNTITANLNGNDIFQHGVDGPYTLSAKAVSDDYYWFKPDVFVTAAYSAKQFEGGQLTFIDSFTDYGRDSDSNGKYDTLCIGFRCRSSIAGYYTIHGKLRDDSGMAFEASVTVRLNANANMTAALEFDLAEILKFGSSASYNLEKLTITENSTGNEILVMNNVYRTTGNYASSSVELPKVMFTGNNTTVNSDDNNDGLYDALILRLGVNVTQSGNYIINGLLVDENFEPFYRINQQCYLDANSSYVEVSVDGLSLSGSNINDTITLLGLQALDANKNLVAIGDPATFFIPDKYAFVHRSVRIVDGFECTVEDKTITVTFNVFSEKDAAYNVNARLLDSNGDEVCWKGDSFTVNANKTEAAALVFTLSEADLENHGNVFSIGSFSLYNVGTSSELDSLYIEYVDTVELEFDGFHKDIPCLRSFLEQTDSNGVKNGAKINSSYNPNDTSTWKGVTWKEINGEVHATSINWGSKKLTGSLNLSGCPALTTLILRTNNLTSLNVSACTELTRLECQGNPLTSLDVSKNTALKQLSCSDTNLTELDVSKNTALTYLSCGNAKLTQLDVSKNTALTDLRCMENNLTQLDVSNHKALTYLSCYSNQLTSLNVSGCTALADLDCRLNQLTTLNASGCTALINLDCRSNKLTSLSLSGCTALSNLNCESNQLTSLNVSGCTSLTYLSCGSNQFSSLDVSKNAALRSLLCWNPNLVRVAINSNIVGLSISMGSSGWTFKNSMGSSLAANVSGYTYNAEDNVSFPIRATNSSGSQTISFVNASATVLQSPTLSVSAIGPNAVAVTVGKVQNASSYSLQYSTSSSFDSSTTTTVPVGSSPVYGLKAETTYYFRVMAIGSGNYYSSDYSAVKTATTVQSVSPIIAVNENKVTVSWVDGNPAADAVRYRVVGTTKWTTAKLKAGVTTYTFSGALGANYEIEVLLDQQERSVMSGSAVVLDQAKLSAVKNEIKDDTFQVSVTNYTAKNLASNAQQAIVTINGVKTTLDIANQQGFKNLSGGGKVSFSNGLFTFTEMKSNTQYKVQISFSDGNSVSKVSSALSVKTTKTCYQAPAITSATAVSNTSITVTWETAYGKKSNAAAQKYTVQYSTDGVKWTNATTGATGNSYTIQKLKGGVEYRVRVLATKDSAFEASASSGVLTAETLALPKIALEKNSVKDDSFKVNVTNYLNSNLVNATAVNVKSDKFGTAVVYLQNGTGAATFSNGMTVVFRNGALSFTNVPSNIQQKIQVNFSKGVCTTAWSNALTIKTLKAAYNKPVLTNVSAVSSTSIEVDWNSVYGKNSTTLAQKYTVQYSTDGVKWTNATTSATGTSFTITKLKPNTKYLVAVIANKDSMFNASAPSNSQLATTFN